MKAKNRWANILKNLLNQKSNNFTLRLKLPCFRRHGTCRLQFQTYPLKYAPKQFLQLICQTVDSRIFSKVLQNLWNFTTVLFQPLTALLSEAVGFSMYSHFFTIFWQWMGRVKANLFQRGYFCKSEYPLFCHFLGNFHVNFCCSMNYV